jgi:FkbM family methyltransferase
MHHLKSYIIFHIAAVLPERVRIWIARSRIAPLLRSAISHQPGTISPVEIIAGPARGMRIVTDLSVNRAYSVGIYEPENVSIIKHACAAGMTAIDVGAHEGYLTLVMAACVGSAGQVFAFEPMPRNFKCLSQTVAMNNLNNVVLYQMAVSNGRNAKAKFQISDQSSSMGKLVEDESALAESELEVTVTSLDQIIESGGIARIDFVKIDVEGHDLEVLEGMQGLVARFRPKILIEFHSPDLLLRGHELLAAQGYQLSMDPSRIWTVFAQ